MTYLSRSAPSDGNGSLLQPLVVAAVTVIVGACGGNTEGGLLNGTPSASGPEGLGGFDAAAGDVDAGSDLEGHAQGGTGNNPPASPQESAESGIGGSSGGDASPVGSGGETMTPPPEVDPAILDATPKTRLRLLTQVEYRNSVVALLGADVAAVAAALSLPEDVYVAGFGTVGAAKVVVTEAAVERYEQASLELVGETFADDSRWSELVGCVPQPDLGDACVESYVRGFGRRAFRRDPTDREAIRWIELARATAVRSEEPNPTLGLAAATVGILQSPNFLYRVEYAEPDLELGRIRFDGLSMATRLAYLATGAPPDEALLASAERGELDTTEGLRGAIEQLLTSPNTPGFLPEFFIELTQLRRVLSVTKAPDVFPEFDVALQASMLEETELWLENEVLAPGSDVRSLFTSTTTFVDARLAALYGLPEPVQSFARVELPPESARAGVLGKAGFLSVHSSSDFTSPTRRGTFVLTRLLCVDVPPPPADVVVTVLRPPLDDGPRTTRELMAQHLSDPQCVNCHALTDPFGYALEHFDAIGRYRETENGLPIDATGQYEGIAFDGAVELGQMLHDLPETSACLVRNFYRYANGAEDDVTDAMLIDALTQTLSDDDYVWRDWFVAFATSSAYTSLPATVE